MTGRTGNEEKEEEGEEEERTMAEKLNNEGGERDCYWD